MKLAILIFETKGNNDYGEFPVCRQAGMWQLKNKLKIYEYKN